MQTTGLELNIENKIATITFNRPEKANAFDNAFIESLHNTLTKLENDESAAVIIFRAKGQHFSAGGDLKWMLDMANSSIENNKKDALQLALLLKQLNEFPKPTIAVVRGNVMGGGVGLAACCDIVLAHEDSQFSFSEAKLGLIPATIAPYAINKIGVSAARHYFLTAEFIDADTAKSLGLVHELFDSINACEIQLKYLLDHLEECAPGAMSAVKQLINQLHPIDEEIAKITSQWLAKRRCSDEAKEGITAFLEKRSPSWYS